MLCIGDQRVDTLAQHFGTPLLVLDLVVLSEAIAQMRAACDPHGVRISYAAKALITTALARYLTERGINLDCSSLGEVATAQRAGVAPDRLTLHGAGKTDEELDAALRGAVGRIAVDNLAELRRLRARGTKAAPLDVVLRLNTGIEAHTHEFIRTAGDDSKFGFAPHEEREAIALLREATHLRLRGLHAHIGSQVFEGSPFVANAELLVEAMVRYRDAGFDLDTLIVGGGFGVQMHPSAPDEFLDLPGTVASIAATVERVSHARGLTTPRIEIEPGRSLIAAAGTSIYRVRAIKRYDRRTFVVVDGSMADNPRPALYGAYHHVALANRHDTDTHTVTLCGRSCENDELATASLPRTLREDDLLAMCTTGAYTYSMASNYNRFTRPAVVAVGDGEPRLFVRRESLDDLLHNDVG